MVKQKQYNILIHFMFLPENCSTLLLVAAEGEKNTHLLITLISLQGANNCSSLTLWYNLLRNS